MEMTGIPVGDVETLDFGMLLHERQQTLQLIIADGVREEIILLHIEDHLLRNGLKRPAHALAPRGPPVTWEAVAFTHLEGRDVEARIGIVLVFGEQIQLAATVGPIGLP